MCVRERERERQRGREKDRVRERERERQRERERETERQSERERVKEREYFSSPISKRKPIRHKYTAYIKQFEKEERITLSHILSLSLSPIAVSAEG